MIEYRFQMAERYRTRVALNVNNLTDDRGRYRFIYAPGRSYRLSVGVAF